MTKKEASYQPDYKRAGYARRRKIKNFILLNLGTLIIACGIHFFKYPNNFALGGVAGLTVVLNALIPSLTPAWISFILNISLLVVGLLVLGKSFAGKTLYASLLMSVLLILGETYIPVTQPLTDESLLELILAIACSGAGAAILFNLKASSGGTDIIAMIIRRFTDFEIGKALLVTDLVIALSTFFIFDVKTGLLSCTGLVIKSVLVSSMIRYFNRVKCFTIITSEPEKVGDYVTHELGRSCTRMEAVGEYTGEPRSVFLCVVDLHQANLLRDEVKKLDPQSFTMISESSEITGRGFTNGF